ncbi:unnamed protein product, partial [Prorocentrum cordatum]
ATVARLRYQLDQVGSEISAVSERNAVLHSAPPAEEELWAPGGVTRLWHQEGIHMEKVTGVTLARKSGPPAAAVASCSVDGTTVVHLLEDGAPQPELLGVVASPDAGAISAAAFVPTDDVEWVLACGGTETWLGWGVGCAALHIYSEMVHGSDAETARLASAAEVVSLAGRAPGLLAVAAGQAVTVWDLNAESEEPALEHSGELLQVHMPAKDLLVALSQGAGGAADPPCVSLWDLRQRRRVLQLVTRLGPGECFLGATAQLPQAGLLAAAAGTAVQTWDLRRAVRPLHSCDDLGLPSGASVSALAVDGAGELLALAHGGGPGGASAVCLCAVGAALGVRPCEWESAE